MLRSALRSFSLLLTMLLLASGCGDESSTNPQLDEREAADDLATQAAAAAATATGGFGFEMEATSAAFRSNIAKGTPPSVAADTTITLGNLTFTFHSTFYDAQNDPLPGYSPLAVRLEVATRATGSISTLRYAATLGRTASHEVQGIHVLADTLEFDGAAQDTAQCEFHSLVGDRQRYFFARGSRTVQDVRLLKDRFVNPWPLSGRVTWVLVTDRLRSNNRRDVEFQIDGVAVLTFDGTQTPELLVNGTFRYRVNLLTGELTTP